MPKFTSLLYYVDYGFKEDMLTYNGKFIIDDDVLLGPTTIGFHYNWWIGYREQ